MKFWDKLMIELNASGKQFSDIYSIMMANFAPNIFCKTIHLNQLHTKTYQELDVLVRKVAGGLREISDFNPIPDFIGIKLDNSINWVAAFYGSLMAGFRPLLINTRNSLEVQQKLIDQSNLKFIIADGESNTIDINSLLESKPIASEDINWRNEVALTTSGTTGTPKICIYDGGSISAQIHSAREAIDTNYLVKNNRKGEVIILAFLPFYHIFGFIGNLMWFGFFGRTFVFLENYDPKTIQNTVKLAKVTHMLSIPLVWNGIANTVMQNAKKENKENLLEKSLNFSIKLQSIFPRLGRFFVRKILFKNIREKIFGDSLVFLVSGGSYINERTLKIINGLGYPLFNGFGMTEIGIYSVDLSKRASQRIKGNVGHAFTTYEHRLDSNGQLLVRGRATISGYYENKQVVKTDEDAWFATNDIFIKQRNGALHHEYRHDEMIIGENGENISPHQIEGKFILPYAKHAVVIGFINSESKYIRALVVELVEGFSSLQETQTIVDIYETISKLPFQEMINKVIVMRGKIPVLLESKIERNTIRKQLIDGSIDGKIINRKDFLLMISNQNSKKVTSKEVIEVFARVLNIPSDNIHDDSHFAIDLNGSSMEYFALIAELSEKYNVEFNIDQENLYSTPISFSNYIVEKIEQ